MNKKGFLEVICGPMFSGKSEELIRRLHRAHIARQTIISFNPSIDTRTPTHSITSHNGATIKAVTLAHPQEMFPHITKTTNIVGIDEAQFFSNELVPVVCSLVEEGKRVIIAGLNLDFRGVPFGTIPLFMAIADTVTKLSAICVQCGDEAYFSQRIVNGSPASFDDPIVQPGAQETYQARCRSCYSIDKKPLWQKIL